MSLEVTGKLYHKGDTQQVSEKFKKREFVLEIQDEVNGQTYLNYGKFQLVQTKCEILDRFKEGDMVTVKFNIKGNKWERDGKVNFITNLDAWRIESAGGASNNAASAQSAAPVYNNNGGNNYSGTPNFNPSPETIDDLPF